MMLPNGHMSSPGIAELCGPSLGTGLGDPRSVVPNASGASNAHRLSPGVQHQLMLSTGTGGARAVLATYALSILWVCFVFFLPVKQSPEVWC